MARLADLAADPDAPGAGAGHPPRRGDPARLQPLPAAVGGPGGRSRPAARRADRREPVRGVRAVGSRWTSSTAATSPGGSAAAQLTGGARERHTHEPLPARPAATVMLVRDTRRDLDVFLMRRHSRDGVRRRGDRVPRRRGRRPRPQRRYRLGGSAAALVGASGSASRRTWPMALVCAAARETFEESGRAVRRTGRRSRTASSRDASVTREARAALADRTLSFADFLRRENLVLRSDLLRPWANWVTPESRAHPPLRHLLLRGALPEGQRADGENTESDLSGWALPRGRDRRLRGRSQCPAAADLDPAGLAGRPHRRRGAGRRTSDRAVQPLLEKRGDNWVFEFFDSDRYHRGPRSRWIDGVAACERVRQRRGQ